MGHWEFDSVPASSVRMEPTQKDQFNNDEVSLPEALVRESIQNSSDAFAKAGTPVKVRFAIRQVTGDEARDFSAQLNGLRPHYEACGFELPDADAAPFKVLSIEDFGTRGLTGSVVEVDNGNFDRFWRAVGDSGKKGKAGGRWGLGKLVYSSSSALKHFFGLTITAEDPSPALMGQAVLRNHRIADTFYPAHGFYFGGRLPPLQLQQPVAGDEIEKFVRLGGLKRSTEPGLSVIIPYLVDGISEPSIIAGVVSNYFFPILAGRLTVEVGDVVIDKTTFLSVAEQFKPLHPIPFDFVSQISATVEKAAEITASTILGRQEISTNSFSTEEIARMKQQFVEGNLVRARVPVELKPKIGLNKTSFIDLYLRTLPETANRFTLVARNAITLTEEQRYVGGMAAYSALVATDEDVCSFLGDAENPSHTRWNTQADKLKTEWRSPVETLSVIRKSLRQFYMLIAEVEETDDEDLLIDFFSILEENRTNKGKKPKTPKVIVNVQPREKAIVIKPRKGGFEITAGPAAANWTFPRLIRVRVAYDMIGANPFNRHSPFDFDLSKNEINVETTGASCTPLKANVLKLTAESPNFRLECHGFDNRRDIVVDARAV